MNCHVVLAVRPFGEGKSRLAAALSAEERIALNGRMFDHVMATIRMLFSADHCTVVSRSQSLLERARADGLHGEPELGHDLNAALRQGAEAAAARGAEAVLTLSSDLPFLAADDLRAMLEASSRAALVIATDEAGIGTNALLMRPPLAIPYLYGDGSRAAHLAAARAAGLETAIVDRPGLSRDIDIPADLERYPGSAG